MIKSAKRVENYYIELEIQIEEFIIIIYYFTYIFCLSGINIYEVLIIGPKHLQSMQTPKKVTYPSEGQVVQTPMETKYAHNIRF